MLPQYVCPYAGSRNKGTEAGIRAPNARHIETFFGLPFWKLKTGVAADLSHCTSNSKCFGYTGDDLKKAVKDCHVSTKPETLKF